MTKVRKTALAFGAACAIAFTGGLAALNVLPVAAVGGDGITAYYGSSLNGSAVAKAFYNELVKMAETVDENGLSIFRRGESLEVTITDGSDLETAVKNYAGKGDMTLIKQFGAALDCFRYDYADLFYIDFNLLTVNVIGKKTETGGGEEGGSGEEVTVEEGGDETPETPEEYIVTIGAGRAASYLLFNPEDLNGKTEEPDTPPEEEQEELAEGDKEPTLYDKYAEKYAELIEKVNNEFRPPVSSGSEEGEESTPIDYGNFTVEQKVNAVNKVLGDSFSYGFGNNYVNTTYFITETGNKPNASSEGFARLFKTIMHTVGVNDCLIVSGYYVTDGTAKACTWNYVKDNGDWYAVDVANNMTGDKKNRYLFVTGDVFYLDHYENGVVSLSNYKLEYPVLKSNHYNVVTGELQVAHGAFGNRNGIVVSEYTGEGTLSIRVKDGEGNWGAWVALESYETENRYNVPEPAQPDPENPDPENPGGEEEGGDAEITSSETKEGEEDPAPTIDETNCKVAYDAIKKLYYLFDLESGKYEIAIMKGEEVVETNEFVADSIDSKVVPIPLAGENDKRLSAQPLKETPFEIVFGSSVKISEGAEVIIDFTVGSLSEDEAAFVKEWCRIDEVALDGNKLSFRFTPCGLTKYSGLKYTFTFPNLVEDAENGTAVPQSYSVVFKYENDKIRTSGVFVGSNLYTDIVTQPSLVFNNELSLSGWKYDGNKDANDNMISALALSVGRLSVSEDLTGAIQAAVTANTTIFDEGAFNVASAPVAGEGEGGEEGEETAPPAEPVTPNTVEAYSLNLTLDGKAVTIPSDSYLKLSFPYPAGHGPEEKDNIVYKVFQFKYGAKGNVDYTSCEMLDVVAARQGLVVATNNLSASFVIVAFDAGKIKDNSKIVLTETSGVGGKVSGNPVNRVTVAGHSYTITPDAGYVIDSVSVNGVEKVNSVTNGTFKLEDSDLQDKTYNVLRVEFRPAGEAVSADDFAVANGAAAKFAKTQIARAEYSLEERALIVTDYPIGGAIHAPKDPPVTASTQMQMIIVLSVVGGIALIGVIAIIYCGAIRPKVLREREEEAARIAAQRERRANRNKSGSSYDSRRR